MNRIAKWMLRMYPAAWRARYGDEVDALLADTGADARVVADLLKGGVRMQFSTWSFAKLAVVLGIAGVMLGGAASFLITPVYVSHATLELTPATAEYIVRQTEPAILSRTSLAGIVNAYQVHVGSVPQLELYEHERKVMPLEDVIEKMRSDVRFDLIDSPGEREKSAAFRISFQYPDPAKARLVTATLVDKFRNESFQQGLDEAAGNHKLYVIDPASLPVRPIFPNEQLVLLVGCLLGASIPFAWRRLRRKTIATWGFLAWVAVFGFVGLTAASFVYALDSFDAGWHLLHERYRSTATMFPENGSPEQMQAIATDATGRTTLSTVINDPRLDLYKKQRKTQPLEDVIHNMQKNLAIAPSGPYFNISFEYSDPIKTQMAVTSVMNRMEAMYRSTYGGLPDAPVQATSTVIKVIDEASMPVLPVSPDRYAIAMKGGLGGLLAAAVIATIRRRWKPEADLPVDAVNG